ncbi:high mobility group box domain-containing protein [Ephemerocybe angulata]|uniref:High mobility group box domain-containing protein n=1 Tax=Ephemerocybe angulata TaxID=980116 RepID=A0A8H6MEI7_9AGAR|nr:high mobility group box domain-containing protein [Tulosesus angulatus]
MLNSYQTVVSLGYHSVDSAYCANWPVLDANAGCDSPEYSTQSYYTPSPPPRLVKRRATRPSQPKKREPGYIARPPNAFFIFRSEFWAKEKAKVAPVERDHRDISRIVAHCWHSMSADKQKVYYDRAKLVKEMHRLQYPHYRLKPAVRRPRARLRTKREL